MLRLACRLTSQPRAQLCCVGRVPPAKSSTVEPIAFHCSFPLKSALSRWSVNLVQSVESLEVMLRLACRLTSHLRVQLFCVRREPPARLLMAEPPVFLRHRKFQNAGDSVHLAQFASSSMGMPCVFIDRPRLGILMCANS